MVGERWDVFTKRVLVENITVSCMKIPGARTAPLLFSADAHVCIAKHFRFFKIFVVSRDKYKRVSRQCQDISDKKGCQLFVMLFRYSFISQGTSTRKQRSDLFGLRVNLPTVSTSDVTRGLS